MVNGKQASCITSLQASAPGQFTGHGCLIAIIDSGIAYWHPDFRNADGSTRIRAIWDQTITPDAEKGWLPPEGYTDGVVFDEETINRALGIAADNKAADGAAMGTGITNGMMAISELTSAMREICPSTDVSGHGTHVAGIAAGNGRASNWQYRGVAYEAALLIIKLGTPDPDGFPSTSQLMQAVNFSLQCSEKWGMPLCINLSFGNTYGSHSGTSLLETYLDGAAQMGRTSIVVGSGNEGADAGHISGRLEPGRSMQVEFTVGNYEPSLSIQIWKNPWDEVRFSVISPTGERAELFPSDDRERMMMSVTDTSRNMLVVAKNGTFQDVIEKSKNSDLQNERNNPVIDALRNVKVIYETESNGIENVRMATKHDAEIFLLGNTRLYAYYGQPSPYQIHQEIYLEFLPRETYLTAGVWRIALVAQQIKEGDFAMWMPAGSARGSATGFLQPTPETTLTIPSTASRVITVGAYDSGTQQLAAFSGRGYTWNRNLVKPELVAPGVDIVSCFVNGGYESHSGTSMAAPFVTGSCAILMQWGIVDGNDPYLYGDKLKAQLIHSAKTLPFETQYPNPQTGWGALCVN